MFVWHKTIYNTLDGAIPPILFLFTSGECLYLPEVNVLKLYHGIRQKFERKNTKNLCISTHLSFGIRKTIEVRS